MAAFKLTPWLSLPANRNPGVNADLAQACALVASRFANQMIISVAQFQQGFFGQLISRLRATAGLMNLRFIPFLRCDNPPLWQRDGSGVLYDRDGWRDIASRLAIAADACGVNTVGVDLEESCKPLWRDPERVVPGLLADALKQIRADLTVIWYPGCALGETESVWRKRRESHERLWEGLAPRGKALRPAWFGPGVDRNGQRRVWEPEARELLRAAWRDAGSVVKPLYMLYADAPAYPSHWPAAQIDRAIDALTGAVGTGVDAAVWVHESRMLAALETIADRLAPRTPAPPPAKKPSPAPDPKKPSPAPK